MVHTQNEAEHLRRTLYIKNSLISFSTKFEKVIQTNKHINENKTAFFTVFTKYINTLVMNLMNTAFVYAHKYLYFHQLLLLFLHKLLFIENQNSYFSCSRRCRRFKINFLYPFIKLTKYYYSLFPTTRNSNRS